MLILTRAPVSSVVQLTAIVLAASHRAHTCIVQSLRYVFTCACPIQFEVDSNHLGKWIGSMHIQSELVQCASSVDVTNAYSVSSMERPYRPYQWGVRGIRTNHPAARGGPLFWWCLFHGTERYAGLFHGMDKCAAN